MLAPRQPQGERAALSAPLSNWGFEAQYKGCAPVGEEVASTHSSLQPNGEVWKMRVRESIFSGRIP